MEWRACGEPADALQLRRFELHDATEARILGNAQEGLPQSDFIASCHSFIRPKLIPAHLKSDIRSGGG
jgi:hypothetical protein